MGTVTKVALIALLWIAVTSSVITLGGDTEQRLNMAHAWWTGTEESSLPPSYKPEKPGFYWQVFGVGGKRYVLYDPGQSMLMIPGDWLGTQLHQSFPEVGARDLRRLAVTFLIFLPLNIAVVLSGFWLLRLFNFEEKIAGLTSIIWLIGTTVLPYAQIPFQNNQILLFVTLGYASALACVLRGQPRLALLSGLATGAALLIRITTTIHALTIALFLVGCIAYSSRDKLKILKILGLWIVGFIPLALLGRIFDYIRYGSFWTTGYTVWVQQMKAHPFWSWLPKLPENYPFTQEPYVGIWGVLFSPAKSIFIYDPLLLPCLVLGIVFWKRLSPYIQWYLITGFLNLSLHIALTSRTDFWHGDSAWGARYQVTSVHLLLIPLLALFIQHLRSAKKLTAWLMRGILVVAILVQMSSVIMDFSLEDAQSRLGAPEKRFLHFRLGQRVTNIICQVNSSFSEQCPSKVAKQLTPDDRKFLGYYNRVALLPFHFVRFRWNRKWTFIVWGAALMLAIGTTIWLGREVLMGRNKLDSN
jgi:hypothetical protein